jgi:hypothetical protein
MLSLGAIVSGVLYLGAIRFALFLALAHVSVQPCTG